MDSPCHSHLFFRESIHPALLYRQESQERMDRSISTVEPVLVILLSVLIGAVLLSVMLPLLGIISSL